MEMGWLLTIADITNFDIFFIHLGNACEARPTHLNTIEKFIQNPGTLGSLSFPLRLSGFARGLLPLLRENFPLSPGRRKACPYRRANNVET